MTIAERAAKIRLLLFDVDGVMSDGTVLLHPDGTESKQFHIRDGTGIVLLQREGLLTGLISARTAVATTQRAAQLSMSIVRQGVLDKLGAFEEIVAAQRLTDDQVAYMGDDLVDLPVLARVGLATAPADAVPEVRAAVDWVSQYGGGQGAVRELAELVLRAQSRWTAIVAASSTGHFR